MSFKTSFQWFADFNTSTTGMQIVQFSAGGDIVRQRLAPMFAHYRKYKLGAIHVKFVPAATLPVDPTGLSYEEGEQTVDPRDIFNPGLVRTTNGEDVYVPSEDVLNSEMADSLYYSTMLDKRWKKFRLQKGISLRAFPKFWGVANLRQNMYPGYETNVPRTSSGSVNGLVGETGTIRYIYRNPTTTGTIAGVSGQAFDSSSPMSLFQTGQKVPMGWMPTGASLKDEYGLLNGVTGTDIIVKTVYDVYYTLGNNQQVLSGTFDTYEAAESYKMQMDSADPLHTYTIQSRNITLDGSKIDAGVAFAPVPEIPDLLTLVLPRSHKTQFYYRVYVKEDVYFADPVTSINAIESTSASGQYFAPIDAFARAQIGVWSPAEPVEDRDSQNTPFNDGGSR